MKNTINIIKQNMFCPSHKNFINQEITLNCFYSTNNQNLIKRY